MVDVALPRFRQLESSARESRHLLAIDHHAADEMAIIHLQDVLRFEIRGELLSQDWCILRADPHRDHSADIAKDGVSHGIFHLGNVLVSDGEIESVLTSLR